MRRQVTTFLFAIPLFAMSLSSLAQDVYRAKGPDGRTVYSDQRTAPAGAGKMTIKLDPGSPQTSAGLPTMQGTGPEGGKAAVNSKEPWHEPVASGRCIPLEMVDMIEATAKKNVRLGYRSTRSLPNGGTVTEGTPEHDLWIAEQRKEAIERCKKMTQGRQGQ